jgi:hypothetical protein
MGLIFYIGLFLSEIFSVYWLDRQFALVMGNDQYMLAIIAVVCGLVMIEFPLARSLSGNDSAQAQLKPILFCHVPWVLYWSWPSFLMLRLPEPHDFPLRKFEILFGVILVTHLFAYSGWLLWRCRKNGRKVSQTFGLVAVFFFVGTTLWTATVCDLSGDEPHYLLITQSLARDGDLDLSNNYQNRDYEAFYHRGELQPQALEHVLDGKRYSHHPVGTALLMLPGFKLAGRMGAAITMALLAALTLFLTLFFLEKTGAERLPLQAVGVVGLFSSPLFLFSGLIFPEIPTACLVATALLLFLKKRWAWLGFCLGAMLWMHNRNVLLVIPLLVFAALEISRQEKDRFSKAGKFIAAFAFPVASLVGYFLWVYGVATPLGAHHEPFSNLFYPGRFFIGFFGLILDQECGLWFHFPVFALMPAGIILLLRSRRPLNLFAAFTLSFFYLFMSFYQNIGLTPAARYMVGVTPLLLVALYAAFEKMSRWDAWARLTVGLFAVGVFVNGILAAVPWMRYNKLQGENWILKIAGGFLDLPLTRWEAAFQAPVIEMRSYFISLFWVAVVATLTVLFLKKARGNKST